MERESFEDPEIARRMNEHFVCVKVDREERPDVDAIYMDAVQAMTGPRRLAAQRLLHARPGAVLRRDLLPADAAPGHAGLAAGARGDRRRVAHPARRDPRAGRRDHRAPGRHRAAGALERADPGRRPRRGGRRPARPVRLDPGRLRRRAEVPAVLGPALPARPRASARCRCRPCGRWPAAASTTRSAAASPATRSTRMDRAALREDALRQRAARPGVPPRLARERRRDAAPRGRGDAGVHPARAAGPGGRPRTPRSTRTPRARRASSTSGPTTTSSTRSSQPTRRRRVVWFGATAQGNFEGTNVLESRGPEPPPEQRARIRERLMEVRAAARAAGPRRQAPHRVERARARRPRRGRRPARAGGPARRRAPQRRVPARHDARRRAAGSCARRTGRTAKLNAYLEDHAFLVEALLDLYEATFEPRWFAAAREIADAMIDRFADPERGGFFSTSDDHEQLVARRKDIEDNPIPSGSSSAALGPPAPGGAHRRGDLRAPRAAPCCASCTRSPPRHPQAFGHLLLAIAFALHPPREVALAGDGPRGARARPARAALAGGRAGRRRRRGRGRRAAARGPHAGRRPCGRLRVRALRVPAAGHRPGRARGAARRRD